MNCAICGKPITDKNHGYSIIEKVPYYFHNVCRAEVDAILDAPEDEDSNPLEMVIFTDDGIKDTEILEK